MDINSYLPPSYFAGERQTDKLLFGDAAAGSGVKGDSYEKKLSDMEAAGTGVTEGRDRPISQMTYDGLAMGRLMHIENNVQPSVTAMSDGFEGLMEEMSLEAPKLAEKDWDFSIDEAGEFVILEGNDKLSDDEMAYLKDKFEKSGLDDAYADFADTAINTMNDSFHMRKAGLSKENFSEKISGREFLNTEKLKHEDDPISLKSGEKLGKASWTKGLLMQAVNYEPEGTMPSTEHIKVKA